MFFLNFLTLCNKLLFTRIKHLIFQNISSSKYPNNLICTNLLGSTYSDTKRKREIFFSLCKPSMLSIHRLMYIVEVFTEIKRFASNLTSSSKSLQTPKFYCFNSMDHKGSASLSISSLGINMLLHRSGSSYPTTKTPQRLTRLLHMVPLRDWTKIQGRIGECNQFCSPISPRSQNP
jgi:hypothetical protein